MEEKVFKLLTFMYAQPAHREIYYRVLTYCKDQHLLQDIEEFIMALPQYSSASQSPFFIIDDLRANGALECLELDEDGNVIGEEDKVGLDEDQIDDLIVNFAYKNTEIGNLAEQQCTAASRFNILTADTQEYLPLYYLILSSLTEKKGASTIDTMIHKWQSENKAQAPVSTSVVLENLEKSGVIHWDKGWMITEEGKELLNSANMS